MGIYVHLQTTAQYCNTGSLRLVKTDSTPAHCEASYIKDGVPSGYTGMNLDLRH